MEDTLISFQVAKLAKEKGFNFETYKGYLSETIVEYFDSYPSDSIRLSEKYSNSALKNGWLCTAPTQSLLQKWLREKHKIDIIIIVNYNQHKQIKTYRCGIVYIKQLSDRQLIETFFIRPEGEKFLFIEFSTYEEALEIGLQEALKLI